MTTARRSFETVAIVDCDAPAKRSDHAFGLQCRRNSRHRGALHTKHFRQHFLCKRNLVVFRTIMKMK
jgi:hypothetical protein